MLRPAHAGPHSFSSRALPGPFADAVESVHSSLGGSSVFTAQESWPQPARCVVAIGRRTSLAWLSSGIGVDARQSRAAEFTGGEVPRLSQDVDRGGAGGDGASITFVGLFRGRLRPAHLSQENCNILPQASGRRPTIPSARNLPAPRFCSWPQLSVLPGGCRWWPMKCGGRRGRPGPTASRARPCVVFRRPAQPRRLTRTLRSPARWSAMRLHGVENLTRLAKGKPASITSTWSLASWWAIDQLLLPMRPAPRGLFPIAQGMSVEDQTLAWNPLAIRPPISRSD